MATSTGTVVPLSGSLVTSRSSRSRDVIAATRDENGNLLTRTSTEKNGTGGADATFSSSWTYDGLDRPTSGRVEVEGRDVLTLSGTERTRLREGMQVTAQNVAGSPSTDLYGLIDHFDGFMPAGFYYHRFHRPAWLWPFFLKRSRAMAGLGVLGEPVDLDVLVQRP